MTPVRTRRGPIGVVAKAVRVAVAAIVLVGWFVGPAAFSPPAVAGAGPAYGTYLWPLVGPVIRGFEPPTNPFGPGHRGIDIAASFGTDVDASASGIVAFAGWVAGSLFVSIDHRDGVRTTYSWLSAVAVKRGQAVDAGQVIGSSGHGHPDVVTPHLHFGARIADTYIDPMLLLEGADVAGLIRLAPLGSGGTPYGLPRAGSAGGGTPTMGGLERRSFRRDQLPATPRPSRKGWRAARTPLREIERNTSGEP